MGLHAEITADIKEAFNTDLADAVKKFTASRVVSTQADEDWLTNGIGQTSKTVNYSGRGVFGGYAEIEVDGNAILMTDVKLTCLQDEVKERPKNDDTINGYKVMAVMADPADVTFTIQLRKV